MKSSISMISVMLLWQLIPKNILSYLEVKKQIKNTKVSKKDLQEWNMKTMQKELNYSTILKHRKNQNLMQKIW